MSENRKFAGFLASGVLCLLAVQPSSAQESETTDPVVRPSFGGPTAVENILDSDRADKKVLFDSDFFDDYFSWKDKIKDENGFSFGTEYTSNYFTADANLPATDDYSFGGMFRFVGNWEVLGRGEKNTGTLSFKVDHRHAFSDIALSAYSLTSIGYVDAMASTFSDEGWRLTNLHWRQSWDYGKIVLLAGLISAPDFLDVYTLGSPWMHFQSIAYTTGAGTISLPGDAAVGAIVGGWVNDNLYILGGFEDANSVASDFFKSFETVSDGEFFKHVEIGWTTSRDKAYIDNIHLTLWQSDERKDAGVAAGDGAILSYTHYIDEKWMPFVRVGYANDGASLLEKSVSVGLVYQPDPIGASDGNLLGVGINWGEANEAVYGAGLRSQSAVEVFYRIQVTKELAVTPDIQYLRNPALNPAESSVWVFGLRLRLSL